MPRIPITGYANRFSLSPGETINFKVSSVSAEPYSARLVRVISGDPNPDGPGIIEEDVEAVFTGVYPSRYQYSSLGSCMTTAPAPALNRIQDFTIGATIWPTTPHRGEQAIIGRFDPVAGNGYALVIGSGGAAVLLGHGGKITRIETGKQLVARRWYRVWACYDSAAGTVRLRQQPVKPRFDADDAATVERASCPPPHDPADLPLIVAALGGARTSRHYNGKIERPFITAASQNDNEALAIAAGAAHGDLVAAWDFASDMATANVPDTGPDGLHGTLINLPARAMTSSSWNGSAFDWTAAPDQYAATHFHDDDLYDCGWDTDFSFKVPESFKSGIYAARLRTSDGDEEMIPFFVTAPRAKPQSRICVLIPSYTYTVYANIARGNTNAAMQQRKEAWNTQFHTTDDHRQFGLSTYNFHSDGSGISYSSRRRPIITMRSGFISYPDVRGSGCRHFAADGHLWTWLEKKGHEFDVITDDELHAWGHEAIAGYNLVMTCSHPEYHTPNSLDTLQDYVDNGGRLMYLGGNGFYWKVAVSDGWPDAVEIRRGEGGIRAWAAEPGEYYNAFDGTYGGLWRRNGRPPQLLAGVGFSSQGDHDGGPYVRSEASRDPDHAWMFEGIEGDLIGDFGLSGGGAAGFELDRADSGLGTPRNAVVLASSSNHGDSFVLVPEDILTHHDTWPRKPVEELIRADIVYFETPKGGAVFSVGSITFCGSLPVNDCDNDISIMTDNVVRRFLGNA